MSWRVYEVRGKDRERLSAALADDLVSRTSITIREASHFGWDRDTVFAVLEGPENVLQAADEAILAYGRVPPNAEAVRERVRWEDERGAEALGATFEQLPWTELKPSRQEKAQVAVETARTWLERAKRRWRTWRMRRYGGG